MMAKASEQPVKVPFKGVTEEKVLAVKHWTDTLFSFRITRPEGFRFRSGEFVMLGLEVDGKPLLRAYSMASPAWDEELEFFSIKVADGPLTSRLQKIQPGDNILLGIKPTGTLVMDALIPGRNLYLFSSGTGFAPFASIIRDIETYDKFEHVIVTHTCRKVAELGYSEEVVQSICDIPYVSELAAGKLTYFNSITREDFPRQGRITKLIENGDLFKAVGREPLNPEIDRVMVCGAMEMIADTKKLVEAAGLTEGSNAAPSQFVVEKAFAG